MDEQQNENSIQEDVNITKIDPQKLLDPENLGGVFTNAYDLMKWLEE